MTELQAVADRLVVMANGRAVANCSLAELLTRYPSEVLLRTAPETEMAAWLRDAGAVVRRAPDGGGLRIVGIDSDAVWQCAADHGVPVQEMTRSQVSLETVYLHLTTGDAGPSMTHRPNEQPRGGRIDDAR